MTQLLICLLTLLFSLSSPALEKNADLGQSSFAAKKTASLPRYYIENGVRRSIASREAQLGEIPAAINREGPPPAQPALLIPPPVLCWPRMGRGTMTL